MKTSVHRGILTSELVATVGDGLVALAASLRASGARELLFADVTGGGGDHTEAWLRFFADVPAVRVLTSDQDPLALGRLRERFATELSGGRLELARARFSEATHLWGERLVLGWVADLGFSSDQLDHADRGLSFRSEGPLDMRLDQERLEMTAADWLAQASETEIADTLYELGGERFSKRIAHLIVSERARGRAPKTTTELSAMVVRATPSAARHGRLHVATRTFQALRIRINRELEELDSLLASGMMKLVSGGRAGIMTFHSLEDRRVKQAFKAEGFRPVTKKPIRPGREEARSNPRSRSAKLRVVERNLA